MEDKRERIAYEVEGQLIETFDEPQGHQGAHRFKGWYKQGGYILRRCNHRRGNKRGYYQEHRLIIERSLKRFLERHEVVHHINQIKDDNRLENLEVISEDSKHAKAHIAELKKNGKGRIEPSDPMLEEIKFRLYDRNSRITREYSLSKLINTRFVRGCFEFKGRSTGLKDKNGKLIYEGDILRDSYNNHTGPVEWESEYAKFVVAHKKLVVWTFDEGYCEEAWEIIGNIYENPELLEAHSNEHRAGSRYNDS